MITAKIGRTAAAAAAAGLVALTCAAPAYATPTADAQLCAALTVEGVELVSTDPTVSALLNVALGVGNGPTADGIADVRRQLGCGPAPVGRTDEEIAADVCAVLSVEDILGLAARLDLSADVAAALGAVDDTVLPGVVDNARASVDCAADPDDGAPVTTPATPAPTVDGDADPVIVGGGDSPFPVGAPATGSA